MTDKVTNGHQQYDEKTTTSKDYYFDSYSHFGIHEEMLKDSVRTLSYRNAILKNKDLFKDKIVLDVGCGTGILCMFAAQAGAKQVFGIEKAGIFRQAREIVKDNGFENVITILNCKVEEAELPVEKVDIILSEWMGYFLLYESMLDTVIYARDKWLAPNGLIFPDKATIYLSAIEDAQYRDDKIDFWDDVYGFRMGCIKRLAILEPLVDTCEANQVISNSVGVLNIDLYSVKLGDLDFSSDFEITFNTDDYCHALVGFFSVQFPKQSKSKIYFSTGPKNKYTHWRQTVFYFEEPLVVHRGDKLQGYISVKRHDGNPRDLDIDIQYGLKDNDKPLVKQHYRLR